MCNCKYCKERDTQKCQFKLKKYLEETGLYIQQIHLHHVFKKCFKLQLQTSPLSFCCHMYTGF